MNLKIKQFAKQSGFVFYDLHNINGEDLGETIEADDWKALEIFANLILQEYIGVIDKLVMDEYMEVNSKSGNTSIRMLCSLEERVDPAFLPIMNILKDKLIKHFGIE